MLFPLRYLLFVSFALPLLVGQTRDSTKLLSQTLDAPQRGFAVRYPANWQAVHNTNFVWLANGNLGQSTSAALSKMAQIFITTEVRLSHDDAVNRLREIASEYPGAVTYLTIGGWPAMQRRIVIAKEQPGAMEAEANGEKVLKITTAIAAGNTLIRAEARMPPTVGRQIEDQVRAIQSNLALRAQGNPATTARNLRALRAQPRLAPSRPPASKVTPQPPRQNFRSLSLPLTGGAGPGTGAAISNTPGLQPGLALRVINGGYASEPEIAVSTNGQNIVIGQQGSFSTSNDGGKTFPFTGNFVNRGGDASLSFGRSSNFYEGTINIGTSSSALNVSTDNGRTFAFRANAFTCPASGPNVCGFSVPLGTPPVATFFPDQEHIAADRFNSSTTGGDQVYFAWRQGTGFYGISCSTDSGQNFGAANLATAGDFPRITVGQDGFVYIIFVNGGNINLNKYSSCQSGLAQQAGFPRLIASSIAVNCPVPGLDRCNSGNQLHSHMVAVDDTNANHIYASYAQSTSATNENVVVQDSTDGGTTWNAARTVTISSAIVGRRFMPWVCSVGGSAHVSWYDRRASTGANNDLTDYFAGTASLDVGGNLVAGTEVQINPPGSVDAQCNAGRPAASAQSWPAGARAATDSTSCTAQPQLAGACKHSPSTAADSNQPCSLTGANTCAPTESCKQNGGGVPKYGDYNGNACAAGRLYTIWASAAPPPGKPATGAVDLYFASSVLCCAPQIQAPGIVTFPDLCAGGTAVQTVNVCNTGKADLSIDPISSSNPTEFSVDTPSSGYPVVVAQGACFPFQARFIPSSPGVKTAILTIPSNDPVTPSAKVVLSGKAGQPTAAAAIGSSGDFGMVCPGGFKDMDLTLNNRGTCPLLVSNISSSSFDFKTPSVLSYPLSIAPGASLQVPLRFEPGSAGPKNGSFSITSNDPAQPTINVPVKGVGGQPMIATVVADTGDFGSVCQGKFRDLSVTIANSGQCPLKVTAIASSSPEFETAQVLSYPLLIAPGTSLQVPVRFRPTSSGSKSATVTISSDDPAAPTKAVTLKAVTPPDYICHPPTFAQIGLNVGPTYGPSRTGDYSFGGFGKFLTPFGVRKTYAVQAQGEYLYYDKRQEGQGDGGLLARIGDVQAGAFASVKWAQMDRLSGSGRTLGHASFTVDILSLPKARFGFFGTKGFHDGVPAGLIGVPSLRVVDQFGGSGQVQLPLHFYLEGNIEWLHRHVPGLDDRPGGTLRFVRQWHQIGFTAEVDFNETFVGRHDSGRVMFGIQIGHWPRPSDLRDKRNPLGTYVPRVHYELSPP